jgi:hypothetical protein
MQSLATGMAMLRVGGRNEMKRKDLLLLPRGQKIP